MGVVKSTTHNVSIRYGHWNKARNIPGSAFTLVAAICSECRKESVRIDIDKAYTFCPYCGADMRTGKKGGKRER